MERLLEPEVMSDPARVQAYAEADFGAANARFVADLVRLHPDASTSAIVDIGCGPADVPIRLARAEPRAKIVAVDASAEMLSLARAAVARAALEAQIRLLEGRLPGLALEPGAFDGVISNSLLHHLPEPDVFWREARRLCRSQGFVFVVDLFRPESVDRASEIVEATSKDEHPLLKADFFNSLLAAFTIDEVSAQLREAGLGHLRCEAVSDRHWMVSGRV
jgi:ubiquinone/menaquinone biosynthesis C-methylase UbiE